ncbi:sigma-70 family RNA polymerase sigma factor [Oceanobacillus luteolus]|uniref:Sigma-70 family RNA polymerase sigma factor n=1 Tax=Oceanobacillus luteolus TaxID=1274358 RepID=A0ABW4HTA6_9BACI
MKALFNNFYEKYHHDLYNFVYYMVKNKNLAEDLVQEIYIRIFRSYGSFRGEASEKTWAFSIARNVIYDYFRKEKRKRNYANQTVDWDEMASIVTIDQKLPDELLIEDEDIQLIYRLLDECSLNQKQVIVLRYIQGFTLKETSEMLDMSIGNVKTLQHRGINKLKNCMKIKNGKEE